MDVPFAAKRFGRRILLRRSVWVGGITLTSAPLSTRKDTLVRLSVTNSRRDGLFWLPLAQASESRWRFPGSCMASGNVLLPFQTSGDTRNFRDEETFSTSCCRAACFGSFRWLKAVQITSGSPLEGTQPWSRKREVTSTLSWILKVIDRDSCVKISVSYSTSRAYTVCLSDNDHACSAL